MAKHRHAELMLKYSQDAMETEKPWMRWEFLHPINGWIACEKHPDFLPMFEYRRKQMTVKIGGFEFPEPIREVPDQGQSIFVVSPLMDGDKPYGVAGNMKWYTCKLMHNWLRQGLCHLTHEAAQAHADVLNAICQLKAE